MELNINPGLNITQAGDQLAEKIYDDINIKNLEDSYWNREILVFPDCNFPTEPWFNPVPNFHHHNMKGVDKVFPEFSNIQNGEDLYHCINKCLKYLENNGGGTFFISNHGVTKSPHSGKRAEYTVHGPIHMRSCTRLILESDLILKFIHDKPDLPRYQKNIDGYASEGHLCENGYLNSYEGTLIHGNSALIRFFNVKNSCLSGALPRFGASSGNSVIHGGGSANFIQPLGEREEYGDLYRLTFSSPVAKFAHMAGGKYQQTATGDWVDEFNNPIDHKNPVRYVYYLNASDTSLINRSVFVRPPFIQTFLSQNILIERLKIVDTPFWNIHLLYSKNIIVRYMSFADGNGNGDGVDPESTQQVIVENSVFDTKDDILSPKTSSFRDGTHGINISGSYLEKLLQNKHSLLSEYTSKKNGIIRMKAPSTHQILRNCTVRGHTILRHSNEHGGGIAHIYVYNIDVPEYIRSLVDINGGRVNGGETKHVYIENITINRLTLGLFHCVLFTNYYDFIDYPFGELDINVSMPDNIINLVAKNISVRESIGCSLFMGWNDHPVENVFLENILIENQLNEYKGSKADMDLSTGIYTHNVKSLFTRNVLINGIEIAGIFDKIAYHEYPLAINFQQIRDQYGLKEIPTRFFPFQSPWS